jgi:hypothetical protein
MEVTLLCVVFDYHGRKHEEYKVAGIISSMNVQARGLDDRNL